MSKAQLALAPDGADFGPCQIRIDLVEGKGLRVGDIVIPADDYWSFVEKLSAGPADVSVRTVVVVDVRPVEDGFDVALKDDSDPFGSTTMRLFGDEGLYVMRSPVPLASA